MAKVVLIDGVRHRRRRGKLVPIPPEWAGKVTSRQAINKRPSKMTRKLRRRMKSEWRWKARQEAEGNRPRERSEDG